MKYKFSGSFVPLRSLILSNISALVEQISSLFGGVIVSAQRKSPFHRTNTPCSSIENIGDKTIPWTSLRHVHSDNTFCWLSDETPPDLCFSDTPHSPLHKPVKQQCTGCCSALNNWKIKWKLSTRESQLRTSKSDSTQKQMPRCTNGSERHRENFVVTESSVPIEMVGNAIIVICHIAHTFDEPQELQHCSHLCPQFACCLRKHLANQQRNVCVSAPEICSWHGWKVDALCTVWSLWWNCQTHFATIAVGKIASTKVFLGCELQKEPQHSLQHWVKVMSFCWFFNDCASMDQCTLLMHWNVPSINVGIHFAVIVCPIFVRFVLFDFFNLVCLIFSLWFGSLNQVHFWFSSQFSSCSKSSNTDTNFSNAKSTKWISKQKMSAASWAGDIFDKIMNDNHSSIVFENHASMFHSLKRKLSKIELDWRWSLKPFTLCSWLNIDQMWIWHKTQLIFQCRNFSKHCCFAFKQSQQNLFPKSMEKWICCACKFAATLCVNKFSTAFDWNAHPHFSFTKKDKATVKCMTQNVPDFIQPFCLPLVGKRGASPSVGQSRWQTHTKVDGELSEVLHRLPQH